MAERVKPEEAIGHVRDAFDEALTRCGGDQAAAFELLHLLATHVSKKVSPDEGRPISPWEVDWALISRKAMDDDPNVTAVITCLIDSTGVVRPLASTKGLPERIGETLRSSITQFLCGVCGLLFKKPFRCGCRTCENGGAEQLKEAIAASRAAWSPTKAEA